MLAAPGRAATEGWGPLRRFCCLARQGAGGARGPGQGTPNDGAGLREEVEQPPAELVLLSGPTASSASLGLRIAGLQA